MSIFNYIDINYINPLQTIPVQCYYSIRKKYSPLNSEKREHHIVVSLTSFPPRFNILHLTLKSILNQSLKPDVLFLCLKKDEINNESELPSSILELKKYGLTIYIAEENLNPHNKYLYAMKQYPDSLIITIDDDVMYDKNLLMDLYNSYLKYPKSVSARRVHKILKDKDNNPLPYTKWGYEYKKLKEPSMELLSTGVGGVLYPPGLLPTETFDTRKIRELCLNADDIWLKFMEIKNNIPVVWVKGKRCHPLNILRSQKISLQKSNYHDNINDMYINELQNYYGNKII